MDTGIKVDGIAICYMATGNIAGVPQQAHVYRVMFKSIEDAKVFVEDLLCADKQRICKLLNLLDDDVHVASNSTYFDLSVKGVQVLSYHLVSLFYKTD